MTDRHDAALRAALAERDRLMPQKYDMDPSDFFAVGEPDQ